MPPIVPLLLAAAGLYAGARWFAKQLSKPADNARSAAGEWHKGTASNARVPRDLGTLEFDSEAGVYRPKM